MLVNTPNNPSGAVYSAETLTKLAEVLTRKAEQYGHDIFLISDEPYREIVFDGKQQPYVSKFYANTISCYSFSKALSLPGERIGYLAVNPACPYAAEIVNMCGQISRGIGHNCPTSLMQLAVSKVLDLTPTSLALERNSTIALRMPDGLWLRGCEAGRNLLHLPESPGSRRGGILSESAAVRSGARSGGFVRLSRIFPHGILHRYREGGAFPAGAAQNDERNLWLNEKP